jgi:xylulokinase
MAVLGIDLGTQSVKVVGVDDDGSVLASVTRPYVVDSPVEGWAESDPQRWLHACEEAAAEVMDQLPQAPRAMGLSGQMHGVVLCDAAGTPVRPAILWADSRSATQARALRSELGPTECARLGSAPFPGFAGPTLRWLAEHEPDSLARARWALQPKDWLRMKWTGEVATEPSDASGTLLYDLEQGGWSSEAMRACRVREDLLAPIRPSAALAGEVTRQGSALQGLPVALGGADAACAVHGLGLVPGEGSLTIGTGAQIASMLTEPHPDPTLRTHTFAVVGPPGAGFMRLGAVQSGGLALERALSWLGADLAEARAALAEGIAPGDPLFHPFVSGERSPYVEPDLRAAWTGLSLATTRKAMLRSVFEGMAYAVVAAYAAVVESDARPREPLTALGGGSRDSGYLQLLSDALGVALQPSTVHDATAVGAARLGGAAIDRSIPPAARAERGRVEPVVDPLIVERQGRWRAEVEGRISAEGMGHA